MENNEKEPVLRFPIFYDNWTKKCLYEIATKRIDKNKDSLIKVVFTNSANFGVVNQRDFFDKDIANQNNLTGYYIVEKNDFIYNPRISNSAPVGPISRNKIGVGVMSPLYSVFRFNCGLNLDFIEHYFSTKIWHKHMEDIANYGARADRMSFAIGDFYKMPIILPSSDEQTKIASFLTSVDDKLQALKKKKELLEQYKKGVMQQLFSQELRFKKDDGTNYPDWEEKNGSDIFENISSKKHNSDLPILAISQEHGAIPRDLIDYQISVTEKSVESYKVVEKGDFIISLRSFQGGIEYSKYKGICSPAYIILRAKLTINDMFYKNFLKTEYYISRLNEKLEGIRDGKMISYKYFSDIELPYPTIEEQTKIANFLSAIDDKIAHCLNELDGMERWKKGLLQQMFC